MSSWRACKNSQNSQILAFQGQPSTLLGFQNSDKTNNHAKLPFIYHIKCESGSYIDKNRWTSVRVNFCSCLWFYMEKYRNNVKPSCHTFSPNYTTLYCVNVLTWNENEARTPLKPIHVHPLAAWPIINHFQSWALSWALFENEITALWIVGAWRRKQDFLYTWGNKNNEAGGGLPTKLRGQQEVRTLSLCDFVLCWADQKVPKKWLVAWGWKGTETKN